MVANPLLGDKKMAWWDSVYKMVNVKDIFYTPGRGMDGGNKKKPFSIISKEISKIIIRSGKSPVPLVRECFDVVEEALTSGKYRQLRVAALKSKEAFENSADKLIKQGTKSDLARANYVCALLEHCGLVKYAMKGNQKVIGFP